ncbi:hypothetical protein BDN71DRAFT_1438726 [Pleurotus eryngii]|uniref:Uncharacterized protein n=1 Tax=Pleurotus eryngii TaxID=5323 RepID=A0A9P6DK74_PLEER|nr:hypothetical protein BDN71DRAFT_1438726 [Pleurotus eryngii]
MQAAYPETCFSELFGAMREGNYLDRCGSSLFSALPCLIRPPIKSASVARFINRPQHEPVGRAEGLTTKQLRAIRFTPPFFQTNSESTLGPQLSAAMLFADWITRVFEYSMKCSTG